MYHLVPLLPFLYESSLHIIPYHQVELNKIIYLFVWLFVYSQFYIFYFSFSLFIPVLSIFLSFSVYLPFCLSIYLAIYMFVCIVSFALFYYYYLSLFYLLFVCFWFCVSVFVSFFTFLSDSTSVCLAGFAVFNESVWGARLARSPHISMVRGSIPARAEFAWPAPWYPVQAVPRCCNLDRLQVPPKEASGRGVCVCVLLPPSDDKMNCMSVWHVPFIKPALTPVPLLFNWSFIKLLPCPLTQRCFSACGNWKKRRDVPSEM